MDERAYRGGVHPPYCTCVECTRRRRRRDSGGGPAFLTRPRAWLRRLLTRLAVRRRPAQR